MTNPTLEQMLREFHTAAQLPLPAAPTATPSLGSQTGRQGMLDSELTELAEALAAGDIVAIADAIADCIYVLAGTAVTYGVPLDRVLAEVHRSNMTKVPPAGPVLDPGTGKILKGPGYECPQLAAVMGLEADHAA